MKTKPKKNSGTPIYLIRRKAMKFCSEHGVDFNKPPSNKDLAETVAKLKGIEMPSGKISRLKLMNTATGDAVVPKIKTTDKKASSKIKKQIQQAFYESDAWRTLRYKALREQGANCQCCGRNYRDHKVAIHVDHIKPRSKFPELELELSNLQILCADCNLGKSNKDSICWR